jgi:hypothetical protein
MLFVLTGWFYGAPGKCCGQMNWGDTPTPGRIPFFGGSANIRAASEWRGLLRQRDDVAPVISSANPARLEPRPTNPRNCHGFIYFYGGDLLPGQWDGPHTWWSFCPSAVLFARAEATAGIFPRSRLADSQNSAPIVVVYPAVRVVALIPDLARRAQN